MADRYGDDLRRTLRSAERLSERAISPGVLLAKTLLSKSSALLLRVTVADHVFDRRRLRAFAGTALAIAKTPHFRVWGGTFRSLGLLLGDHGCTLSVADGRGVRAATPAASGAAFEVLHRAFVPLCLRPGRERAKVAALARLRVDLAGIETVLPGPEFADHAGGPDTLFVRRNARQPQDLASSLAVTDRAERGAPSSSR